MSVHLLGSNHVRPQAAVGDGPSESEEFDFENWLLAAGHAIPLMWLFLYSKEDLVEHPVNLDQDQPPDEKVLIPCTGISNAASRLANRTSLINEWFGANGSLQYHVDLFCKWLNGLPYQYLSLDWLELMEEEGLSMADFEELLAAIDAGDSRVVAKLVELSTIHPETRFITLAEAQEGNYTKDEMHNFFYLMGDGDHHRPPWS